MATSSEMSEELRNRHLVNAHIAMVQLAIHECIGLLLDRCIHHDESKFSDHELPLLNSKSSLDNLDISSEEYREALAEIDIAVQHHYMSNDHHPEFYENGMNGMSLLAMIEMLCDWKVASCARDDGSLEDSIEYLCGERYKTNPVIRGLLMNTAKELGWIKPN